MGIAYDPQNELPSIPTVGMAYISAGITGVRYNPMPAYFYK